MSIVELISPVPGLNARLSQNICFMQTPVASSQILFIIIVTTVELTDAFRSATTMLTRVIVNNFLENLLAICRCFESFPVVSSYVVFLNEVNILSHHCTFQMLSLPSASLTFSALTCRTSFFFKRNVLLDRPWKYRYHLASTTVVIILETIESVIILEGKSAESL